MLVARTFGAPAPPRRLRRRPKPKLRDPDAGPQMPLTELTVVDARAIEGDPQAWLGAIRGDGDRRDDLVEAALAQVARAFAARRVASRDPGIADPSLDGAIAVRVGYGDGDSLVEGRYGAALELPREAGRSGRAAALRPQERMAALLSGRERPLACEELVLRARSDLNAARIREAALQLRVGLEALLAERGALAAAAQEDDLAFLDERRGITGDAANEALQSDLSNARAAEVAETLAVCERILRRRAAQG